MRSQCACIQSATRNILEKLEQRQLFSSPTSTAANFWFGTAPHELRFTFDQDVSATVGPENHFLTNLTTGEQIDSSKVAPFGL